MLTTVKSPCTIAFIATELSKLSQLDLQYSNLEAVIAERLRYLFGGFADSVIARVESVDLQLSPAEQQMKQDLLGDKKLTPAQEKMKQDLLGDNPLSRQVGGNHYKWMKIQHFTFCQENGLGWGESAAIKYICRHQNKNGAEDLDKAIHYLQLVKAHYYPAQSLPPSGQ